MSAEKIGNIQVIHLIIYMVSLFAFMKASIYGLKFPNNRKYWIRTVIPLASITTILLLLYTIWI